MRQSRPLFALSAVPSLSPCPPSPPIIQSGVEPPHSKEPTAQMRFARFYSSRRRKERGDSFFFPTTCRFRVRNRHPRACPSAKPARVRRANGRMGFVLSSEAGGEFFGYPGAQASVFIRVHPWFKAIINLSLSCTKNCFNPIIIRRLPIIQQTLFLCRAFSPDWILCPRFPGLHPGLWNFGASPLNPN